MSAILKEDLLDMLKSSPKKKSLAELIFLFKEAKQAEEQARTERLTLETLILGEMPVKAEGSVTQKTDSGAVTVTYKVNRKVDDIALISQWDSLSARVKKCFKWKPDVSITELKKIQELLPDEYLAASAFITATPSKPSVSIK